MVIELREPGVEPDKNMNAKGRMLCPVCDVPLSMADRQGVEIDFCPECRGVWLDRGELDKIIERSAEHVAPPPPRHDERSDYGYRKKKKRGGFLEDLFDF